MRYLLWFFSTLLMQSANAQVNSIILNANESPPYWSSSLNNKGMCGEIIQAISKVSGISAQIEFKTLSRLIDDTKNNDLGNPEFYMHKQSFAAIIPIAIQTVAITYYQPNFYEEIHINSMTDLKKYRVGLIKGTITNKSFFKSAGIKFDSSYSHDSLIKKLKQKRIDLSLEIDLISQQSINKLFPDEIDNFKIIPIQQSTTAIAILIAEDQENAAEIGQLFKKALKTMIANGTYQKIIEKYYDNGNIPSNWFKELNKFDQLYNYQ